MSEQPKLYSSLAEWYHLLTAPEEYVEEAAFFAKVILDANPRVKTILELGSGGGANASHMKAQFEMTLTDLSDEMIAMSKRINPELVHIQGDMRTLRLNRTFDAVFAHDAVSYLTSEDDVRGAIETAAAHLEAGGIAVFVPDDLLETFVAETDHGGHDGPDGRGMRYMEWHWDPDPTDTTTVTDFAYLLREADGSVRAEHDRHVVGLFPRATWVRLMRDAGFEVSITPLVHSEVDDGRYEVFVGVKVR